MKAILFISDQHNYLLNYFDSDFKKELYYKMDLGNRAKIELNLNPHNLPRVGDWIDFKSFADIFYKNHFEALDNDNAEYSEDDILKELKCEEVLLYLVGFDGGGFNVDWIKHDFKSLTEIGHIEIGLTCLG